jgi:C6 transcription factor Pro1
MDVRMDKLTGCPDVAVLALAETAHLAKWKTYEQSNGSLSMRDLIRRGDQIEQALRQSQFRSMSSSPVGGVSSMPSGLPAASTADMFSGTYDMAQADEAARRAIPHIWRESAILYLHTVMSDSYAGELSGCKTEEGGMVDDVLPSVLQAFPRSSSRLAR